MATGKKHNGTNQMLRRNTIILFIITFVLVGCTSPASDKKNEVTIPNTETQILHSSTNEQDYQIDVALPENYASEASKTYPVIYVLDGNAWFGVTTTITRMLAFGNELPDAIVVGIGYPTDETGEILVSREIDFTPTKIKDNTGGAGQFLSFLEKDLISFIENEYRTKDGDRTLVGKSHGGLFAFYALFQKPELFNRYIVMSPTLWWNDQVLFELEEEFANTHAELPVKLFLSVGDKEPENRYSMVSNLRELHEKLESRQYNGLEIEIIVMEGETHNSVTAGAISKGIISVFH